MLTLIAFVVALGILIAVHEYGHYRVAVACGIKVLDRIRRKTHAREQRPPRTHRPGKKVTQSERGEPATTASIHLFIVKATAQHAPRGVRHGSDGEVSTQEHSRSRSTPDSLGAAQVPEEPVPHVHFHAAPQRSGAHRRTNAPTAQATGSARATPAITSRM